MQAGDIFSSNSYGDFAIQSYVNSKNVVIRFILTGYVRATTSSNVLSGSVKDPTLPHVYGVGYLGCGEYKAYLSRKKSTPAYGKWIRMLERCYSSASLEKRPTYKGCTVCKEWHNFQNFAKWYYENSPKVGSTHLDKDIRVKGNKVYSAETCTLATVADNCAESNVKVYTLINPAGELVEIKNLDRFCIDNGLSSSWLRTCSKRGGKHRGWQIIKSLR